MLDDQQFNEWVETCLPRVRAQCYRYLGNREDAEDAAQATFLKAYRYLKNYRPGKATLQTWLMVIATRVCISIIRSRGAWPQHQELPESLEDPERPVEIQVVNQLDFDAAMECLSPAERIVLVGKSLHGHTWQELADHTGLSVWQCRRLHLEATRKIRGALEEP